MATDKLIQVLNHKVAETVKKVVPTNTPPTAPGGSANFASILDSKNNDVMTKMMQQISGPADDVQALSAQNLKIDSAASEWGKPSKGFAGGKSAGDLFGALNSDFLSLDATINVLSDPSVKLNSKQLLAYQAGIGNLTLNAEMFSRLAQSLSQNLNTILQTNIG